MRPPEVNKYLFDMLEAGELIGEFIGEKTYEDYCADRLLRSGVERQFEIIGEALSQALKIEPGLQHSITAAPSIIAFRNRLIHGYSLVSSRLVWGIIESDLAELRREIKELLQDAQS